jgi:hypothetical protein
MIEILLQKAGEKIGREIKTRGDCELLSNAIYETLDVDLSYNTIRRLYGLATAVKPSINTLNVIAKFCDYKNFTHFTQTHIHEKKNTTSQLVYRAVYRCDEAEIIALVKSTKKSSEDFIGFLVNLTRELLYNDQYLILDQVYRLKELNYDTFSYSEILELGNSIGLLLRKVKIKKESLLININFLRCVYLTFVDYSNLNGYYGEWATLIRTKNNTKEIKTFTKAILEFKQFLNNKEVKDVFGNLAFSKDLHPILCSRLIAIKILAHNKEKTMAILDKYFKIHSKKKSLLTDYSYELFIIAIATKNTALMRYLINSIDGNTLFYYQKHHMNSFYLMCMFYYKWTHDSSNQKKYAQLFNLNYIRYSYEDFILILYNVYLYADTKTMKRKAIVRADYNRLCKKLQYPYFSEEFLEDFHTNPKKKSVIKSV